MLEDWPQVLWICLPNLMVPFFQPWGQYKAILFSIYKYFEQIEQFLKFSPLTPSVKRAWVSSVFPFFERLHDYYIFTAPTKTTTIISHEPCALNAEFQHFIPRFNNISLLCGYRWKRGLVVKGGPKTGWR